MKVFGIVIVALGLVIAFIGITGSQHRIMDILKGVHLPSQNQAPAKANIQTRPNPPGNIL